MARIYSIGGEAGSTTSHHSQHHALHHQAYGTLHTTPEDGGERTHGAFSFHDMNLAVGDRLQVQCPDKVGGERSFVRIVGYLEHTSLIVTSPSRQGVRIPLLEHDPLVVRAFSRQNAFAFTTEVRHISHRPFEHLHLAFPVSIQGTMVRKSPRVRTRIPCELVAADGGTLQQVGRIENLSACGALLAASRPLGTIGTHIRVLFELEVHALRTALELDAEIVCLNQHPGLDDASEGGFLHGVDFRSPQPSDLQLLKAYVYQRIIEVPHSVV